MARGPLVHSPKLVAKQRSHRAQGTSCGGFSRERKIIPGIGAPYFWIRSVARSALRLNLDFQQIVLAPLEKKGSQTRIQGLGKSFGCERSFSPPSAQAPLEGNSFLGTPLIGPALRLMRSQCYLGLRPWLGPEVPEGFTFCWPFLAESASFFERVLWLGS